MTKKKTTAERLTELENRIADQEGKFNRFLEIQADLEQDISMKRTTFKQVFIALTICSMILIALICYY